MVVSIVLVDGCTKKGNNIVIKTLEFFRKVVILLKWAFAGLIECISQTTTITLLRGLAIYGSRYSRMDQIKFVEDSLLLKNFT